MFALDGFPKYGGVFQGTEVSFAPRARLLHPLSQVVLSFDVLDMGDIFINSKHQYEVRFFFFFYFFLARCQECLLCLGASVGLAYV